MNTRVINAKLISENTWGEFNTKLPKAIDDFNRKYKDDKDVTISLGNLQTLDTRRRIIYSVIITAVRVPDIGVYHD